MNLSSGDPVLDRRLDFAEALARAGDPAAAAEVMIATLDGAPGWAAGWFRLAEWHEAAGDVAAAAAALARALAADPQDRLGAAAKLALLSGAVPEGLPPAFVQSLFDDYAARYDQALTVGLGYRGPALIAAALAERGALPASSVLDLGCGTGLMAQALAGRCQRIEGWDLSPAMLGEARRKGLYQGLRQMDLASPPDPGTVVPAPDLVVAADVFTYLGPLDRILPWIARTLVPGGVLAFSVEAGTGAGPDLGAARRFRHPAAYLRAELDRAGLAEAVLSEATLRQDRGQPVAALIVTARRPPA